MRRRLFFTWCGLSASNPMPLKPVSILFEQHLRERRMRVMRLFAESTFEVDDALKTWLEESGPDKRKR